VCKSDWRSLWSAAAWRSFPIPGKCDRSRGGKLRRAAALQIFVLLLAGSVFGATSVKDYAERLRQAEDATDELTKDEASPTAEEIIATMRAIKQGLPLREDVEMDGQTVRVDNTWLHQAADLVIKNVRGDEEQLRSMLFEIADRLLQLEQRVNPPQSQANAGVPDQNAQKAQLERILARPEYAPEEKKESAIQLWLKKLLRKIADLLARLFGARRTSAGGFDAGTVSLFRVIFTALLLAAASFGLVKLLRWLQARRKKDKEEDVREVLGEELAEDATAADLLNNANALARQGDFRSAIRRAYVALLCEMEQRGKVRLHRAKTNRDYLDELKAEKAVYPTFSVMTGAFEHVWYGHEPATESEFNDFITLYQETVR